MKKSYEPPKAELLIFKNKLTDVIMVSGSDIPGGDNDLPILPIDSSKDVSN